MNAYHEQNLIRLSGTFSVSSVATDPTTVVCAVHPPVGAVALPSVVKDATGAYHADVIVDVPGQWIYQWTGSGAVIASGEHAFIVIPSQVS